MSVDQSLIDKLRALPPERQQEVADFVESLSRRSDAKDRKPRLKGLCADLGVQITAEEIDQARQEMWGGFPREET